MRVLTALSNDRGGKTIVLIYLVYMMCLFADAFPPRNQKLGPSSVSTKRLDFFTHHATVNPTGSTNVISDGMRLKRSASLMDWAKSNGIKLGGAKVDSPNPNSGLGLVSTSDLKSGDVVIEVPTKLAITVETPKDYNPALEDLFLADRKSYVDAPWWAQLCLRLNALDKKLIPSEDMRPWLDALPRQFDTPIHWTHEFRNELQYRFIDEAVRFQEDSWKAEYDKIMEGAGQGSSLKSLSFDDFVWGCECARSRAFSGAYSGSAFNPAPYAFTLLLVALYVGFQLGTVEQAANGAAVVLCGTILKDFVFPKLLKVSRYVVCPFIDMANHKGAGENGEVAFEYFSDGYSLSIKNSVAQNSEIFISYGARSNDQLLQYYGFVEENNPHDVYVMPPLREWDIDKLEEACNRKFSPGRLQKLERAGLLGTSSGTKQVVTGSEPAVNLLGGVVVSRASGLDPAVMQALRALVSSDEEWESAGEAIGNFSEEFAAGKQNERLARLVAKTAIELELASKPTTLEEDLNSLKRLTSSKSLVTTTEETLALQFRIEKKRLLAELIGKLRN